MRNGIDWQTRRQLRASLSVFSKAYACTRACAFVHATDPQWQLPSTAPLGPTSL